MDIEQEIKHALGYLDEVSAHAVNGVKSNSDLDSIERAISWVRNTLRPLVDLGPSMTHYTSGRRMLATPPHKSEWVIIAAECWDEEPVKAKEETWRDKPPLL